MMKMLEIFCKPSSFIIFVLLEMRVHCSGKNCHAKFKNKKMIQEGECENQNDHPVIEEIRKKVESRALSLLPQTCKDVSMESAKHRNNTGGLFDINYPGIGKYEVYCDTMTDSGGWIVFQRRMDGSENFFRDWNNYVSGFGNKAKEFWLGLKYIHLMTKNGVHELRIDMITTNGTWQYAKYGSFNVGSAVDRYKLSVGSYSGNATNNRLLSNNHMRFSTKEEDHDSNPGNCATGYKGAWWYNTCTQSNLNGIFGRSDNTGIWWKPDNMKFTEMKFRKKI